LRAAPPPAFRARAVEIPRAPLVEDVECEIVREKMLGPQAPRANATRRQRV